MSAGPQNPSYALNWRGVGKYVIFKNTPFLRRRGCRNGLSRLVTLGRVLSEMDLTQKYHVDFFQSLYVCGSTRDPKQHPKSQENCSFHNMSPLSKLQTHWWYNLMVMQVYTVFLMPTNNICNSTFIYNFAYHWVYSSSTEVYSSTTWVYFCILMWGSWALSWFQGCDNTILCYRIIPMGYGYRVCLWVIPSRHR